MNLHNHLATRSTGMNPSAADLEAALETPPAAEEKKWAKKETQKKPPEEDLKEIRQNLFIKRRTYGYSVRDEPSPDDVVRMMYRMSYYIKDDAHDIASKDDNVRDLCCLEPINNEIESYVYAKIMAAIARSTFVPSLQKNADEATSGLEKLLEKNKFSKDSREKIFGKLVSFDRYLEYITKAKTTERTR